MANSGGVKPPGSGDDHSKPAKPMLPGQAETGMSKSFTVHGDTGIKRYARKWFPGMSEKQLDEFQKRFLMTVVQTINQQIKVELRRARKEARKLRRAEEGDD